MKLINYYLFIKIEKPDYIGREWYDICNNLKLKGTILFSIEGFNISLCGEDEDIENFINNTLLVFLKNNYNQKVILDPEIFRLSSPDYIPFHKLKLKIKNEIITSNLNVEVKNYDESFVSPEIFNELVQKEDVKLVDLRNDYEYKIGTFKNAHLLNMNEFSELPNCINDLEKFKDKTLITFCTGGIRCEKGVIYLKQNGFKVKQLKGGILNYLEKYKNSKENLWDGECFVFDDRVSVNLDLKKGSYIWCEKCGQPKKEEECVICS